MIPVNRGPALTGAGCASANVNPPSPAANTGYVDFFTAPPAALAWDVRQDDGAKLYSSIEPLEDRVLRLAPPPGSAAR